jgi:hypothetical protein
MNVGSVLAEELNAGSKVARQHSGRAKL